MRIRGLKSVRRAAVWLHSRVTNFVLILGYHRVAKTAVDLYDLCVQPGHFAEQMEVLRRTARVIDWLSFQQALHNGSLPRRAVVLTFDDGYADVWNTVNPLLEAHSLPAITFAVTGALGQEFWWDRLAWLVFGPTILPDSLTMEIGGEPFVWSIMDVEHVTLQKTASSPRHRLLHRLYQRLNKLPAERPFILTELEQWATTAGPLSANTTRIMTATELQSLSNYGLIAIGSHTVTHPVLTDLTEEQQCMELSHSRQMLEEILDQPVTAFSYPHGANDAQTRRLVEKIGFQLACSSHHGIVHQHQNRFALPRFWVPDWDGEQFSRWLNWWLVS